MMTLDRIKQPPSQQPVALNRTSSKPAARPKLNVQFSGEEQTQPSGGQPLTADGFIREVITLLRQLRDKALGLLRNGYIDLRDWLETLGEKLGFHKPLRTPRMCVADAYTTASENFISQDAKDYSAYHITFRRQMLPWMKDMGVKPENAKFVFTGLQAIINDILKDPVTKKEVDEADRFFKTAKRGGPFKWDRGVWDRIVNERNGIIPIKIEALPDGSVNFPGEPCIQVTAEDGFGELAAWFETKLLQVWASSERASMMRHWLDYNKDLVRFCDQDLNARHEEGDPDAQKTVTERAQRMLLDFSDRSSMTAQESEMLGQANLTSFPITSTVAAAYRAYQESGQQPAGSLSVYSLAHRVVESFKKEEDAYLALFNFTKGDLGSYVADCYNYRHAVKTMLLPLALKAKEEADNGGPVTIVGARPDSGDPFWQIMYVLKLAVENGLYKEVTAADGRKLKAMTHLRVFQADGMDFKTMRRINERLIKAGFSPPDCVAYGVGGTLHDALSRSNMSAAMKLAAVGKDKRPVMKSPLGEPAKESIPGEIKVVREPGQPTVRHLDEPGENVLVTWYDGTGKNKGQSGVIYKEDFLTVQKRVQEEFHNFPKPAKDRLYSNKINRLREQVRAEHHFTPVEKNQKTKHHPVK